jgi:crotonobetainyl-CoA:carnitine CoA-transferase CaiB-like acyl-CoA transferase
LDAVVSAPLQGLLVADFTRVLSGPTVTMLLADLGADVIKVERPGGGDETRAWGPPWTEHTSSYFEAVNRSKRSLVLDLADETDRVLARELAARADVLVENFRAATMDRLGLGYDQVRRLNPGVVYCSLTGFGDAAGADLPGYDFIVQAVGGLMSITGEESGPPMKVGVALVDILAGKDATIGILAALNERQHSGAGQHVQVNLLSSLLGALANQASAYLTTGAPPRRLGNRHPSIAPYQTLRCSDGVIAVACGNDTQFRRLTEAVGRDDLAQDARFATNADRVAHRAELVAELEKALSLRSAAQWQETLTAAEVPAGVVRDLAGAFHLARELGLEPTHDLGPGRSPQVRHPVSYSRSTIVSPSPPPALGEHTEELRHWLTEGRIYP